MEVSKYTILVLLLATMHGSWFCLDSVTPNEARVRRMKEEYVWHISLCICINRITGC